ncbi:MAG: hypothetical protein AVDCRST_MAG87-1266 [uncultured Thermomicrobiales bacterium]|uniref:DUF1850 domain-containing protein n=1 Tax=uncultured Thermomicrobiales bacterium TaxID=1645740 RepID=A0A6J4UPF6_9BACT|nr:MAG: hypothetical protein AVDCRST_MAG87-1266 [uncultured Thermomicrobiales bacterium]
MISPRAIAGLVLAIVLVAGAGLIPVTVLRVSSPGGEIATCASVRRGEAVTLVFRNSMFGGDVRETFEVAGDRSLLRTRVVTDNAASAEYYAWDGRVEPVADGFQVMVPLQAHAELTIRVDQVGRHRLRIGDREIALFPMVQGSAPARLHIAREPLISRLAGAFDPDGEC